MPNLAQILPWGFLGKWVKYNDFIYLFIFIFFPDSPTGQTRQRIFTLDGSNDADLRKDVLLRVSLIFLPILGEIFPKKLFLGRE